MNITKDFESTRLRMGLEEAIFSTGLKRLDSRLHLNSRNLAETRHMHCRISDSLQAYQVSDVAIENELAEQILAVKNDGRGHCGDDLWAIEEMLKFERLLANLSAKFVIQPPENIGSLLRDSLRDLVELLGNDRSTLFAFDGDLDHVNILHSYALPTCAAYPLGRFPISHLPWFLGELRSGDKLFVRDTAVERPSLATNDNVLTTNYGLRSNILLPLKIGKQVIGGLSFAFFWKKCDWPIDVLSRLQLISDVFANALERQRMEARLQAYLAENKMLREQLENENAYLREQVALKHHYGRVIGQSEAMIRVLASAERVAVTDTPVLLLGETGTGKELLAQTIHDLSKRKARPLVVVNCASLPATLIESELFGREAGAYTGAASAQIGHFQVAHDSTLFLDEVGELPIELQAKLLRVLEDGTFHRLGSPKMIHVNVRIVAATNRNLKEAIREGNFREDLYHRLNVFPINLPPLRERRDDIPMLTWSFVETLSARMGKTIKKISCKTMNLLQDYSWPGNVRELSNVIERAIILANDDTLHISLPSETICASEKSLSEAQRDQIVRVLNQTGWRIRGAKGAAMILEIKPTTLEARMAKLGIRRPS